ncbi:MAG TPA: universal stress protein, partial [Verrucomicrobiae bacterium]|nr:universal stress protein [Verrucomicrobiae bacterium]
MKPKSHKPEPALPALFEEEPSRIESASPQNVRKLGFKQILVPIDFSDCSATALNYGLTIADRFGAKVTLLHVVEPAVYPENYMVPPSSMEEANQDLISSGRERLAKMVGRIPLQG